MRFGPNAGPSCCQASTHPSCPGLALYTQEIDRHCGRLLSRWKLGIVTPPQGHWNRVRAGRSVTRPPSPPVRGPGEDGRVRLDARGWPLCFESRAGRPRRPAGAGARGARAHSCPARSRPRALRASAAAPRRRGAPGQGCGVRLALGRATLCWPARAAPTASAERIAERACEARPYRRGLGRQPGPRGALHHRRDPARSEVCRARQSSHRNASRCPGSRARSACEDPAAAATDAGFAREADQRMAG